jgi:hypothetical protein
MIAEHRSRMDMKVGSWGCLIPDCGNNGTHHAPGGLERDWLCREHFAQFIKHLLDPVGYPVFPLPLE